MTSVFTRILSGELPGHFLWKDPVCFSILTIQPLRPGHLLLIPRREVDDWLDLEADELSHLTAVAATLGRALREVWRPEKVALLVVGLEVRHVHLHLSPIWKMADTDFSRADPQPEPTALTESAERIRAALRRAGAANGVG